MALTAAELATVKRRAGEAHKGTPMVTDADIQLIADEVGLIVDDDGNGPEDTGYTTTYDLAAVAAGVWREKASRLAENYDFTAEGASFTRSQAYENCMKQARYWHSLCSNLSV